jgi:hypothetical protein
MKNSELKNTLDDLIVISLGTGKLANSNNKAYKNFGILDWIFTKNNLLDIALESSALRDQSLSQDLFGENYYRLNPALPEELSALDDNSEKNILHLQDIAQKYIDENQDLLHKIANTLIDNNTVSHDYEINKVGYFDYFKNGIYSLVSNLKTPIKIMAGILTIGYEGFKLSSMKLSTKHSLITGGNEFLKKYYVDELKAIFAIASASYSIKANLSEVHNSNTYFYNDNEMNNYTEIDTTDTHYNASEYTLL